MSDSVPASETSRVRGRARTLLEWAGRSETAYSGLAEDVSRDLIDALDEIERLREALVEAEYGLREARDYGNEWPIGLDTDPKEQRGMERDTFITNMEHFAEIARNALEGGK